MDLPRPGSFQKLVLLGFGLIVLPLIAALTFAIFYVDKLADQSQHAVYQAAKSTKDSRILVQQVTALERTARQYQVLGDASLFNAYRSVREKFKETITGMLELPLDKSFRSKLQALHESEETIFESLSTSKYNSSENQEAVSRFMEMSETARQVLEGSHQLINREVNAMNITARQARSSFMWFGVALIPALIIIIVGFMIMVAKPINQIDLAIRTLGDGQFMQPISVKGPRDLRLLGQRLEWLRLRLGEVEQEKVKFLRHVSHELKTPLTALREGTDLLSEGVLGELKPEQQEVAKILISNTAQLQALIEDLLNFSVAHQKEATLRIESVSINKLIERVVKDQKLAIMSKNIQLDITADPVVIRGDKEKLRVVLDNLLSNAVKFSPRQSTVGLLVKQNEQDATIDVIDKGPGIDGEEKERVFEAFYQGKTIAEGHIKGTGLGLSIVRDYVEAHGGDVSVEVGDEAGAHLSIRLPLDAEVRVT